MAPSSYDRLTALDNSFLILEKSNAYMHVASTLVFEAGPLKKPGGGIDAEAIKRSFAASLHLIPRYRQRLAWVPLTNQPVWVDDERFQLDFHIRHSALPQPGDDAQLKRLSSRIMQQHLDRRRPLWELWIVEGLEGDRFALISKVHHCMIDGIAGVDMLKILLSPFPDHEVHEAQHFVPRPAPSGLELLRDEVAHWASLPVEAARGVGSLVAAAQERRRDLLTRGRAVAETLGASFRTTTPTPLNGKIGPHRRFDWLVMDLAETKAIRRALGGSLNDIVLTVVTGAVRRFLQRRLVDPRKIDFRVMTPVSVRHDDEHASFGNRVSAWTVDLPVAEEDPRRQLDAIRRATSDLKSSRRAVGAEVLSQVAEWTPSTLLSLAGRNMTRLLPFHMVVTNVPGPQFPMYLLGAPLQQTFPHVPLAEGLGLGIALLSYDGKLCWGFNADYDLLPDLGAYVKATQDAFAELRRLAAEAEAGRRGSGREEHGTPADGAAAEAAGAARTDGDADAPTVHSAGHKAAESDNAAG